MLNTLSNDPSIRFLYNILLGRHPSDGDIAKAAGKIELTALAKRITQSREFKTVVHPTLSGADTDGTALTAVAQFGAYDPARARRAASALLPDTPLPDDTADDIADVVDHILGAIKAGARMRALQDRITLTPPAPPRAEPETTLQTAPRPLATKADHVAANGIVTDPDLIELIDRQFALVLGRVASSQTYTANRVEGGVLSGLAILIGSLEFETLIADTLLAGRRTRHWDLAPTPDPAFREQLARDLAETGIDPQVIAAADTWTELMLRTFLDATIIKAATASLKPEHGKIIRRKTAMIRGILSNPAKALVVRDTSWALDVSLMGTVGCAQIITDAATPAPTGLEVRAYTLDGKTCLGQAATATDADQQVFRLTLDTDAMRRETALQIKLEEPGGKIRARTCIRVDMPRSQLVRKLENITGNIGRIPLSRSLSEIDEIVSKSPFWAASRLVGAELIAAGSGDFDGALAYLQPILEDAEDKVAILAMRLRLLAAAGRSAEALEALHRMTDADTQEAGTAPPHTVLAYLHAASGPPQDRRPVHRMVDQMLTAAPDAHALEGMPLRKARTILEIACFLIVPPATIIRVLPREPEICTQLLQAILPQCSRTQRVLLLAAAEPGMIREADDMLTVLRHFIAVRDIDVAVRFARHALDQFPGNHDLRVQAAHAYRLSPRPADQRRALSLMLALQAAAPHNRQVMRYVRDINANLAARDPLHVSAEAAAIADRLLTDLVDRLEQVPQDQATRRELANHLVRTDRHDLAYGIYEALLRDTPGDAAVRASLIRLAQIRKMPEQQRELSLQALALNPDDDFAAISLIKAYRELGEIEKSIAVQSHPQAGIALRREVARSRFFEGDFDAAHAACTAELRDFPDDLELRLLAGAAAVEIGDVVWLNQILSGVTADPETIFAIEIPLLRYAMFWLSRFADDALDALTPIYDNFGCQAIALRAPQPGETTEMFDRLSPSGVYPVQTDIIGPAPIFDGPLVSVIMTAYNAADYIETSVRSIMEQSYRNIELIVIDDCSPDDTPSILAELEAKYPRMRAILKSTNDGTYVSKNMGMLQARGTYIALQDSDDWSHPDRIAKSVAVLEQRPDLIGVTTDWLRMTTEGQLVVKAGGQISHVCCISLVFRRAEALRRIGFFDSVRIEADMEFIRRLGLEFGARAVGRLRWPFLFGRAHSASLTASEEFGITRTGFTEPRQLYQAAQAAWHAQMQQAGKAPFIPFPLAERLFDAPAIMLPEREKA